MRLMLRYMAPYKRAVAIGLTVKMLATVLELLLPSILSYILDYVVPLHRVTPILVWGLLMVLAATGAFFGNVFANRNAARVARDAARELRHDLFHATMHLTSAQTDAFTVPSLESRLTSDTYHLHNFMGMVQRIGVRAPLILLGGAVITLVMDWRLALVMLITLPLIFLSVFLITRKGLPMYRRTQSAVDGMVRVVREDCQGVRVVKALSREDYEKRRFDKANRLLVEHEQRAGVTMAASQPLMNLFLNLGLVAVILVGGLLVNADITKPGRIIGFMQYFTLMSTAMTVITRIFVMYTRSVASAGRISEVLQTYADTPRREDRELIEAPDGVPHIEFRNVSFSYQGKKNNLAKVSFKLPRGGTLGVIGATGAGKSTLTRLLMGFYEVSEGEILIDGRPIAEYGEKQLHRLFGVVMQHDFIAADTVAENIRFGRELSDEQLRRAARLAQAADFIESFEKGYEHELTAKGTNLSGGQRQRVLIARALAGDPEILILDDASSALDYRTDANLRRAIREEMHTTTVVVAQRVSSVMHADLILVLDRGEVIGVGTHEQLLDGCDAYREISESQMGGAFLD